jgi:hypothetical protein
MMVFSLLEAAKETPDIKNGITRISDIIFIDIIFLIGLSFIG